MSEHVPQMTGQHFHLMLISPANMLQSAELTDLMETLASGLLSLGHSVTAGINEAATGAINIVLGAHLIAPSRPLELPPDAVLYNTQRVDPATMLMQGEYQALIASHTTWDYSSHNIEGWRRLIPTAKLNFVPVGYASQPRRIINRSMQDIDILFLGSANLRQKQILTRLSKRGVRLHAESNCHGAERDALVARSRVVLHINARSMCNPDTLASASGLRSARKAVADPYPLSYLLAHSKAVVLEAGMSDAIAPAYREVVRTASYGGLVEACMSLLDDERQRFMLEQCGFETIRAISAAEFLRHPVDELLREREFDINVVKMIETVETVRTRKRGRFSSTVKSFKGT